MNEKHYKSIKRIAKLYEEGKMVEKNIEKALEYLNMAKDLNDTPKIHYLIANALTKTSRLDRKDILANYLEALKDREISAEVNYRLGNFYLTGLNDNQFKDYEKAEKHLLDSHNQGNKKAACKLGNIYILGLRGDFK